ncbi:MAG: beta-propeller domain-containing protein [Thermotaleaceae bacterium]
MKSKVLTMVSILLLCSMLNLFGFKEIKPSGAWSEPLSDLEKLPIVGSQENLRKLLRDFYERENSIYRSSITKSTQAVPMEGSADSGSFGGGDGVQGDYARTNVQVQGVDEADLVKTDGRYIYQINGSSLSIVDVQQPEKMAQVGKISFEQQLIPIEMYCDQDYLIVVGHRSMSIGIPQPMMRDSANGGETGVQIARIGPRENTVSIQIYDIKDRSNAVLAREIKLEGSYLSSRKIEDNFYLAANHAIPYGIFENKSLEIPTPSYEDTLSNEGIKSMTLDEVQYFPEGVEPNYIILMGLNLKTFQEKANISTYLGQGQNIYASRDNLYIGVNGYGRQQLIRGGAANLQRALPNFEHHTDIYGFELKEGQLIYSAKGQVPGRMLNQFSMDAYEGFFRIATTTGEMWRSDEGTSKNNLYILDKQLKGVGSLEGIAPGERIYAMRFMGSKGYMVTFRETDPFFVLDLKDPRAPKMLGYLKIPGYSDYLHPYDENHIIGFGKEVMEIKGNALEGGMKIAVFDVGDVNKPVEKYKVVIGDRGTESPLLRNHKALLFSKEKSLLAFPVTLVENPNQQQDPWSFGNFSFQGAYIYDVNMEKGLSLQNRISHLSPEDYKKAGQYWYESDLNVQRILYVGDVLYTLSNQKIMAHKLDTMELISVLDL